MPDDPAPEPSEPVRIEGLTSEVGWLFVTLGIIGVILPGIPGAPFLLVGLFVVTPGGSKRLSRWVSNNPPSVVRKGMKPIYRFAEDLERRYPRLQVTKPPPMRSTD